MAMKMNRVVLHGTEIHQTHPHPLPMFAHHGGGEGSATTVDRMPIPIHRHGVGRRRVRRDEKVLEDQCEIPVHRRIVGNPRMDDEQAGHPEGFLHGHMRMVKKCSRLVEIVLVHIGPSGRNKVLGEPRHTIVLNGEFQAMPMDGRRFRQLIVDYNTDPVSLNSFNSRAGHGVVVAPDIHELAWQEFSLHRCAAEFKLFDAMDHFPWHFSQVRGFDRYRRQSRFSKSMDQFSQELVRRWWPSKAWAKS